jgi:hypothetical protein
MDQTSFLRLLHEESLRIELETANSHVLVTQPSQNFVESARTKTETAEDNVYFACGPVEELKSMCASICFALRYCVCFDFQRCFVADDVLCSVEAQLVVEPMYQSSPLRDGRGCIVVSGGSSGGKTRESLLELGMRSVTLEADSLQLDSRARWYFSNMPPVLKISASVLQHFRRRFRSPALPNRAGFQSQKDMEGISNKNCTWLDASHAVGGVWDPIANGGSTDGQGMQTRSDKAQISNENEPLELPRSFRVHSKGSYSLRIQYSSFLREATKQTLDFR